MDVCLTGASGAYSFFSSKFKSRFVPKNAQPPSRSRGNRSNEYISFKCISRKFILIGKLPSSVTFRTCVILISQKHFCARRGEKEEKLIAVPLDIAGSYRKVIHRINFLSLIKMKTEIKFNENSMPSLCRYSRATAAKRKKDVYGRLEGRGTDGEFHVPISFNLISKNKRYPKSREGGLR